MDKEEKYLDIRNKLKNLEQVKASDNFVHNLHSKIVGIESDKRHEHEKRFEKGKGGFLRNLFGNMQYPWLIPAAGFTVLIFFVFYITFLNKNASENKQDLLSTQKQETTGQKDITSQENKNIEKEPAPVTEPDETLAEKEKLPGKDIAGDLKKETKTKENEPLSNLNKNAERDETKIHMEKTAPKDNDGKTGEEKMKSPDKIQNNKQNEIPTSQFSAEKPGVTEDKNFSGMVAEEKAESGRVREKIDSLSKVDLEKLRNKILK